MQLQQIQAYYHARGLSWPTPRNALLFFLSEVGELAQAYLCREADTLSDEDKALLSEFSARGLQADEIVSRVPGWLRNNDRARNENVIHEAADCDMMLSVFLEAYAGLSPDEALLEKMSLKLGYPAQTLLGPEKDADGSH